MKHIEFQSESVNSLCMSASDSWLISHPSKWSWSFGKNFLKALASPWVMVTKALLVRKTCMVGRVTSVIANGAENIQRVIFRWRGIVSQLQVTIQLVVFLICCFLLGMAMKPLPIKGQMGMFKLSIIWCLALHLFVDAYKRLTVLWVSSPCWQENMINSNT